MKRLRLLELFAVLICFLFVSGIVVNDISEIFRMDKNFRWVYEYGQAYSLYSFYGAILWSLINSALIVTKPNNNWRRNTIWTLISLAPILYLGFGLIAYHFEW